MGNHRWEGSLGLLRRPLFTQHIFLRHARRQAPSIKRHWKRIPPSILAWPARIRYFRVTPEVFIGSATRAHHQFPDMNDCVPGFPKRDALNLGAQADLI